MSAPPANPRKRHLAAMQQGRERARRQARRDAKARVRAFQAWLKRGSPFDSTMPPPPSDADFRIARGDGR